MPRCPGGIGKKLLKISKETKEEQVDEAFNAISRGGSAFFDRPRDVVLRKRSLSSRT